MNIKGRIIIASAALFFAFGVRAQSGDAQFVKPLPRELLAQVAEEVKAREHYTYGTILDGDTVPLYHLREVKIYASGMLLTQKEIKQNAKLIRNVRLMRPYAIEGKRRLDKLAVE